MNAMLASTASVPALALTRDVWTSSATIASATSRGVCFGGSSIRRATSSAAPASWGSSASGAARLVGGGVAAGRGGACERGARPLEVLARQLAAQRVVAIAVEEALDAL